MMVNLELVTTDKKTQAVKKPTKSKSTKKSDPKKQAAIHHQPSPSLQSTTPKASVKKPSVPRTTHK